jgi:hypothetical protein
MASHGWHLAQVNVSLPLEPLESQRLAPFVAALEPVNAAGEAAPGFIWRLQTEDGNATAVRVLGDDRLIVNLTVWESIEALGDFVFRGAAHLEVLRRRRQWFAPPEQAMTTLWWVPARPNSACCTCASTGRRRTRSRSASRSRRRTRNRSRGTRTGSAPPRVAA